MTRTFRAALSLLIMLLFVLPGTRSFAWSRTGHMIVAAIAYRSLPPELQVSYTELLQHHPDFEVWERDYESLDVDIDRGEYFFMQASFWPDIIRRAGSIYDHPTWHYTNLPLRLGVFSGEITEIEPTLTPVDDVVHGFDVSLEIVFDESKSMEERAAHFSWVLHLVGDIHQPLHSVALVSDVYPEGDRGGNLFIVRPSSESSGINLHALWDGLLGRSPEIRNARNETTRLLYMTEPGFRLAESDQTSVRDWAIESRAIAIEYVYLEGRLEGEVPENRENAPILPEDYTRNAKEIAERRVVIAGVRLARVISGNG